MLIRIGGRAEIRPIIERHRPLLLVFDNGGRRFAKQPERRHSCNIRKSDGKSPKCGGCGSAGKAQPQFCRACVRASPVWARSVVTVTGMTQRAPTQAADLQLGQITGALTH